MKRLIVILVVLLVIVFVLLPLRETPPRLVKSSEDCSVTDYSVIEALNTERSRIGVNPVVESSYLNGIADSRANSLNGTMDNHEGFRDMRNHLDWNSYRSISEELSVLTGCNNSSKRLSYFHTSQKHWDSLMRANQTHVGVGFHDDLIVITLGSHN